MDGHYIHLLSNHFPVILSITGFIILTFGLFSHSKLAKQVGLAILLAGSISTIPAYLSGEEAEHKVEHYNGTSESVIEEHEEEAELAFVFTDVLGVFAFIALLLNYRNHRYSMTANRLVWLAGLISVVLLFNVGKSGGQIRRPELRTEQTNDSTTLFKYRTHR
jgi:uncharacterized membrane protein